VYSCSNESIHCSASRPPQGQGGDERDAEVFADHAADPALVRRLERDLAQCSTCPALAVLVEGVELL
jgi:hypothetical protein